MTAVPDAIRQLVDGLVDAAVVLDEDGAVLFHNRHYREPGVTTNHRVVSIPIREGERTLVVEIYRDVSAQNHLASQLVQVDKMTSLGRLVAGIAHELNNPINFIYGNVDFLGEYLRDLIRLVELVDAADLPPQLRLVLDGLKREVEYDHIRDDWQKLVKSIRAGAERTAGIVRDLRTYSRASGAELREVDVVAQLDTTLTLITPLVRNRIQIRRAVAADVPPVVGNPGHIGQVFMNLLTNAAQAVTGEGWIEVAIAATPARDAVRIAVADSGPGIDPAVIARVVDPFFTTKDVGVGTGLGLWITDSIVRAHGGTLAWDNRADAGAEFVVTLPVRPA